MITFYEKSHKLDSIFREVLTDVLAESSGNVSLGSIADTIDVSIQQHYFLSPEGTAVEEYIRNVYELELNRVKIEVWKNAQGGHGSVGECWKEATAALGILSPAKDMQFLSDVHYKLINKVLENALCIASFEALFRTKSKELLTALVQQTIQRYSW